MSYITWDQDKYLTNIKKHGISFEEAATVFDDDNAVYSFDSIHSEDEARFIVIGISRRLNILFVCHCYKSEDHIHLISARKATKTEQRQYTEGG